MASKTRPTTAAHTHGNAYRYTRASGAMSLWLCAECGQAFGDQDQARLDARWQANTVAKKAS